MRRVPREFPRDSAFWDFSHADSHRSPIHCRPLYKRGGKWEWDGTAGSEIGKTFRPTSDVLADADACDLIVDLADRGIVITTRRGQLATTAPERLTDADRASIARHRDALRLLALVASDATLDRLAAFRAGTLPGARRQDVRGRCHSCGLALPAHRAIGRCGRCAIAARLAAGAPLPPSLLELFDDGIAGSAPAGPPTLFHKVPA